ncbi:MAG TPA: hypothetical protein VG675_07570 [Bryobacteraceae bacterium]|nr:hypothetical protein [Bryobacteraceae bacterium]
MKRVPNMPARNPFLSAEKYATTHFDPAQTDATPYPAPRGEFQVDLRKVRRVPGGPIGLMQLASTLPQYMWVTSSGAVSYVDVSNGGFHLVAQIAVPGAKAVAPEVLDAVLAQRFTEIVQVEKAVTKDLGLDWKRIATNVYMFVDKDNIFYGNTPDGKIHAYGLIDPSKPSSGIKVLRTLDFNEELRRLAAGASASLQRYGAMIVGCNLTYDGKLIVLTNRSVTVIDRSFQGERYTVEFGADEYVSNSMAVDDKNGIYVASDTTMRKIVWTGSKLSTSDADGAWSSPYDFGHEPPSVKFGRGTGSTPTLMGFGDDQDKLVVITDGADRMKIVAFWRDQIPSEFRQQAGTKSRRIAGQLPITCGLSPLPVFIQSEQSVVVYGYGAFVVNNIRSHGAKDKLVDVIAGGPVFDPPAGAERVDWDSQAHQWRSAWTRNDVVSTSMVPCMSSSSRIAFVNGYTKTDGWEITGMDWDTGETVHRTIFGQDNLGNGAYALIQFLENGDLLFNSIGGAARIPLRAQT